MASKQLSILFLDRNKFDFYLTSQASVLKCDLPETAVKDLEIIDESELKVVINNFIQTNKLPPAQIIMVLSQNIFFEKNFIHTKADLEFQVQIFLDNVPFENLSSKILQLEKGFKVIATNSDYFQSIKDAFETQGSSVFLVLPAYIFGTDLQGLDGTTIKAILQKYESVKQYGLIAVPQAITTQQREKEQPRQNTRLFIMIGVFAFLIIILIFLFIQSSSAK